MNKPLERFIDAQGGAKKAANALGVTVGAVHHWRNGTNGISKRAALLIEKVSGGDVSAAQVLFPND